MNNIFFDGAGHNGTLSKFCIAHNFEKYNIFEIEKDFTNNEMEYLGFLYACQNARKGDTILGDSKLVIEQVKGNWKVKAYHLRAIVEICKVVVKEKDLKLCWLPRKENVAGIILDKNKK